MAKNYGDIVTAKEWQGIVNAVNALASEKKINIDTLKSVNPEDTITPVNVNALYDAVNKLEGAFSGNCCQSTCQSQCRCETFWIKNCHYSSCGCASNH